MQQQGAAMLLRTKDNRASRQLSRSRLKAPGTEIHRHACDKCDNTGYKGRLSIGEFINIDDKVSELIHNSASENEISDYVYSNNKKIYENGLIAISKGETSLFELMRVTED